MAHCVSCGRLDLFTGPLNKQGECKECVAERREEALEDEQDYEEVADVRKAGLNPYHRYTFN